MIKLKINPPVGGGGLGFDLRDLLPLLGPRAVSSSWLVSDLNYVSRDDKSIPAFQGLEEDKIPGPDIIGALPNLLQVIDGVFKAYENKNAGEPWVVLRAVDSSWWEVCTQDRTIVQAVRHRFENVEEQT